MTLKTSSGNFLSKVLHLCIFLCIIIRINAVVIYVENSESRTLSRIDTETNQVQNTFAGLGLVPNKVIYGGDYLWSVNSGDNALQKINPQTGSSITNILIESSCNPWDACYYDGYIYVTGLFTNKVYKVNTETNSVENSLNVGTAPEALCVYNGKLYVTNTGGYQNNYANSSVSVIDLNSFTLISDIPVSANPQYIVEKNGIIHVSCTGNWTSILGKVCLINPEIDELFQTIDIGGSLGGLWVKNQDQAFVADGNGINLYQYNPVTFDIINGADNPLSPGGSVIYGNDEIIALLVPNWGSNGKVKILHPDLTFWKEYTIGLVPTDMIFAPVQTSNSDEIAVLKPEINVYPNPARSGSEINFLWASSKFVKKISNLTIYNTKGQLVHSQSVQNGKASLVPGDFKQISKTGVYFYKWDMGQITHSGKFIIVQ